MNARWIRHAAVLAAIATVVAVAATRPGPEAPALRKPQVRQVRPAQAEPEIAAGAAAARNALAPAAKPQDRRAGLQAAASTADREEKLTLLRGLLNGQDAGRKSRALTILRGMQGADAAALAVDVLRKEEPSWLRAQAASVLGEIADPSAVPALLEAARSEDLDVRAGAATALEQFGHAAPLRELIAGLTTLLDHADAGKREDAVFVLSSLQTPATMPALVKALGDPASSRVREAAADALGRTKLTEAIPPLEAAFSDSEPRVRDAAREAVAALRGRKP